MNYFGQSRVMIISINPSQVKEFDILDLLELGRVLTPVFAISTCLLHLGICALLIR